VAQTVFLSLHISRGH